MNIIYLFVLVNARENFLVIPNYFIAYDGPGRDGMAYLIRYDAGGGVKTSIPERGSVKFWILSALVAAILALNIFCPELISSFKNALIPGDPAVTTAAFESMVSSIGNGVTVGDAFAGFCREIILGAYGSAG